MPSRNRFDCLDEKGTEVANFLLKVIGVCLVAGLGAMIVTAWGVSITRCLAG